MKFDSNNREHKLVADDLGLLLKMIETGNIYKDEHSYYAGGELAAEGELKPAGYEYRKKDVAGRRHGFRTQNRAIVPVDTTSKKPMEGVAYYWRHDARIKKATVARSSCRSAEELLNTRLCHDSAGDPERNSSRRLAL